MRKFRNFNHSMCNANCIYFGSWFRCCLVVTTDSIQGCSVVHVSIYVCVFVVQLLQGVLLSTFVVAVSHPQMLGSVPSSDDTYSSVVKSNYRETQTNNPLLYYVMTTNQGN